MIKHFIFLLLAIFLTISSFGQRLGDYYVSISIDSTQGGRLKFLTDSTVKHSTTPRHMSPSFKTICKYKSTDSTIEIFPIGFSNQNIPAPGLFIEDPILKEKITLTKIDGGFIDYKKSHIYVRQKDFGDNPDITYIVNGKIYTQECSETNFYGLITKKSKKNKALQKRLKSINEENCSIEIIRGLDAYKRFGIKKVYGVIIITNN